MFAISSVPRSQIHVPPAHVLLTLASHLIQVIGKPKLQIPLDECSYCSNWGKSKGQKSFSQSSSLSQASQQHSQQGTQQHSSSSTTLTTPTSSDTSWSPSFAEFQQYRAFLATIQGDSTQTSAMTTTYSGLHNLSPAGISPTPGYLTLVPLII